MFRFPFFIILIIVFTNCESPNTVLELQTVVDSIRQQYAPDGRVAIFDVEIIPQSSSVQLKGETNVLEAKKAILSSFEAKGMRIIDEIKELPTKDLGENTFGVINLSVGNIRSRPRHSSELATQALLGTPIILLEKNKDWYRIQTPDGYIAWIDKGGFTAMNQKDYRTWIDAKKVIYTQNSGSAYIAADKNATPVSDLVIGNILQWIAQENDFIKVRYPDGREGFIPTDEVMEYQNWLNTREANSKNILNTAHEFLGRPYLWGGTSGKGLDCSGFTKTVFFLNGIQLPRDASQQVHTGIEIETDSTLKNLEAGDLLFFGKKATNDRKERIWHVAIYLGKGKIIHSTGSVKIQSLRRNDTDFVEERLNTLMYAKRMYQSIGKNGVKRLADLPMY